MLHQLQDQFCGARLENDVLVRKENALKVISILSTVFLAFYFAMFNAFSFFSDNLFCTIIVLLPPLFSVLLLVLSFNKTLSFAVVVMTWVLPSVMMVASWYNPAYNYSQVLIIYMLAVFLLNDSRPRQVVGFIFLSLAYIWMQIRYFKAIQNAGFHYELAVDIVVMPVSCFIMFLIFSRIKKEFTLYRNETTAQKERLEKKKDRLVNLVLINEEKSNRLKQTVLLKEKLISIVCHDVRTPINSFKFLIENYEKGCIDKQMLIDGFINIKQDIITLDNMVVDLINWGRTGADVRKETGLTYKRILKVFESVKSIYNLSAKNKEVQIITELCLAENASLIIPREEMEIVLRNLLSNAIKFSHPKSKVLVQLKADIDLPAIAVLSVRDFGMGISSDKLQMLNSSAVISTIGTMDEAGLGIGLSIVFDIINKHCFDYEITSRVDEGTTFSIKIPMGV